VISVFESFRDLEAENARERVAPRLSRSIKRVSATSTFESPKEVSSEIELFFVSKERKAAQSLLRVRRPGHTRSLA